VRIGWRRRLAAFVGALVVAVMVPGPAHADAPGPTDYRTTIVSVAPATDRVTVSIVGGDSFVELAVAAGSTVSVTGYRGEDYLRFGSDGTVQENRASPTYYSNRSRYGSDIPDGITPDAPARWVTVSHDGRYAWHDHRTHWMNPFRPPGRRPGDIVLEAVVPLVVDGAATTVTVQSRWLAAPSTAPLWIGLSVALVLAVALVATGGSTRRLGAAVTVIGSLALVAGLCRYLAVPPETGPSKVAWMVPAGVVVAASGVATVARRRLDDWTRRVVVVQCAVALLVWALMRRHGVGAAIIPTTAPFWFDRVATVVVGLLAGAIGGIAAARIVADLVQASPGQPADTTGGAAPIAASRPSSSPPSSSP
jgi:hypothetical protein